MNKERGSFSGVTDEANQLFVVFDIERLKNLVFYM